MPFFRKKPVIITAVKWDGNSMTLPEIYNLATPEHFLVNPDTRQLKVRTLEDGTGDFQVDHVADVDDWIIRGVHGEVYACKPEIFEKTYDPI